MLPQASIKRLRFAFASMAGLTTLALIVGCTAFVFSYSAQKQLLDETAPLQINIEQLAKVAVSFGSASRQLEKIDSQAQLERALVNYRSQSDRLRGTLLHLADLGLEVGVVDRLKDVVRRLEIHEKTYSSMLSAKIDAANKLRVVRSEIGTEGRTLNDRLAPAILESSLTLIEAITEKDAQDLSSAALLTTTLNEVQLLTDISFATERFVNAVDRNEIRLSTLSANTSREALAPKFRRLTQLILKIRDQEKRKAIAGSLRSLEEKALGSGGVTDQVARLIEAARRLDGLNRQRVVLLSQMTDLMDKIVNDARRRFFDATYAAQQKNLIAVLALILVSLMTLVMVIWIGRRLISNNIARRIEDLAQSTSALANGNLDVAIDPSGSDELSEIARSAEVFRQNARQLRQIKAELADRPSQHHRIKHQRNQESEAMDEVNV